MDNIGSGQSVLQKRYWFRWLLCIAASVILLLVFCYYFPQYPLRLFGNVSPIGPKLSNCQRNFTPMYSSGPYYNGELFDAHFHLPVAPGIITPAIKLAKLGKDTTINELLCLFDKEKTRGAIAFYMPLAAGKVLIPQAAEIKASTDRLHLFISPTSANAKKLEKVLDENPGLFVGFGEMQFYLATNALRKIDSGWAKEIYTLAAKRHLPVMFHPGRNQIDQVETVLAENPDTIFLMHGYETENAADRLIAKYPNLYYSVDSATLYAMSGDFIREDRNKYIAEFKSDFGSLLDKDAAFWKGAIEKHPDRYMWGTDRGAAWHYDNEMSSLMEEFARAFIGRLDPSVQEKFAYKNAEALLFKK